MPHYMLCVDCDAFPAGSAETPFESPSDQQAVLEARAHVRHTEALFGPIARWAVYTLQIGRFDATTKLFGSSYDRKLYDSLDPVMGIELPLDSRNIRALPGGGYLYTAVGAATEPPGGYDASR